MRLVQATIPESDRESVLGYLDEEGIDYYLTDATTGDEDESITVSYFTVPTGELERVIGQLRDAGLDEDAHVVIIDAQVDLSEEYVEYAEERAKEEHKERIAREELRALAAERAQTSHKFVTLSSLSAIIAVSGFLLDSTPVLIGAMVIAPFLDPPIVASVGSVISDRELLVEGMKLHGFGIGAAVISALAFGLFLNTFHFVPPSLELPAMRSVAGIPPGVLLAVVAAGAGAAGVVSLTTESATNLVGVAIAAALVPAAAATGVGVAIGRFDAVVSSIAALSLNVLAINLAGHVVLWVTGFRPASGEDADYDLALAARVVGIVATTVALLWFISMM